jgi:hypothetical protein
LRPKSKFVLYVSEKRIRMRVGRDQGINLRQRIKCLGGGQALLAPG